MPQKRIKAGEKVALRLTDAEKAILLERVTILPQEAETAIRSMPGGEPVRLSLDELDDLNGFVAAEANHTEDKKLAKALDRVFDKIEKLLGRYTETEDEPPGSPMRPR
jgi:hypothetical protein